MPKKIQKNLTTEEKYKLFYNTIEQFAEEKVKKNIINRDLIIESALSRMSNIENLKTEKEIVRECKRAVDAAYMREYRKRKKKKNDKGREKIVFVPYDEKNVSVSYDEEDRIITKIIINEIKEQLTPRQSDVFKLIQDGYTQSQIAELLNVSRNTVKTHLDRIKKVVSSIDPTISQTKIVKKKYKCLSPESTKKRKRNK